MSTLTKQFEKAQADSKKLAERPDNNTLLKIYALYKQGEHRRCRRKATRFHRHGWPRQMGRLERHQRFEQK